jgi:hypothetical protein
MDIETDRSKPYAKGSYNKCNETEQWIRISEGCPNKCPFCRESFENPEIKMLPIPEIVRNKVKILDMNLLCHQEALETIEKLKRQRVNNKVVYYELLCGIDYRFLTQEIADALKKARFKNIRIAWDYSFNQQIKIVNAIKMLLKAGYSNRDIMIFMICNWKVHYLENMRKVDLCKIWNVSVADCYFDNQLSPNIKPLYWTEQEIKSFRKTCRKHNQLITFRIDPECYDKI